MSMYTTGELAKLCDVTVRTVQYYDARGILVPSELTEGGRRLYSEADLQRMKTICFLREVGMPIEAIGQLLREDDPASVIALLLQQREAALKREIDQRRAQLQKLAVLQSGLKSVEKFSMESIGNIAYTMTNGKKLRNLHIQMLLIALPLSVLQWAAILLWVTRGIWWLVPVWAAVIVPYALYYCRWYFRKVAYICPQCNTVFQPSVKEGLWATHTPTTRRLTCPACGHHGHCVEVAAEGEGEPHA